MSKKFAPNDFDNISITLLKPDLKYLHLKKIPINHPVISEISALYPNASYGVLYNAINDIYRVHYTEENIITLCDDLRNNAKVINLLEEILAAKIII